MVAASVLNCWARIDFDFYNSTNLCVLGESSVLRLGHELALGLAAHGNLGDPAVALWVLVQVSGLLLQGVVDFGNGAANGAENVRGRLDRLNSANGLARADFKVDLGELHVDDVAKGLCSVLGDSECDWTSCKHAGGGQVGRQEGVVRHTRLAVGGGLDPLVVLGVLLLLHCAPVSNARQTARGPMCVRCAETVKSRWWCALGRCHWHAREAGRRTADEANGRAARATEKRAAIVRVGVNCRRGRVRGKGSGAAF